MLPANFQIEYIEPQSDNQPKEKCDYVILPDFYRSHLAQEEYTLTIRPYSCHHFFGSTYICEQLF